MNTGWTLKYISANAKIVPLGRQQSVELIYWTHGSPRRRTEPRRNFSVWYQLRGSARGGDRTSGGTILQGLGYMMGFGVPVSERNGDIS